MNIGDLLPEARIVIPLPAKTLHDAAEQLIGCFVETGLAEDGAKLMERVTETPAREAVVSGGGGFILAFRTDAVPALGAALGVTAEPVELEPESERTARVVLVLVAPYKESSLFNSEGKSSHKIAFAPASTALSMNRWPSVCDPLIAAKRLFSFAFRESKVIF